MGTAGQGARGAEEQEAAGSRRTLEHGAPPNSNGAPRSGNPDIPLKLLKIGFFLQFLRVVWSHGLGCAVAVGECPVLQRPSAPCRLLLLCPSAPLPRCTQRPFAPPGPLPHCPSAPLPFCPYAPLPRCPPAPFCPPFPALLPHCTSAPLPLCASALQPLCPAALLPLRPLRRPALRPSAPLPLCLSPLGGDPPSGL